MGVEPSWEGWRHRSCAGGLPQANAASVSPAPCLRLTPFLGATPQCPQLWFWIWAPTSTPVDKKKGGENGSGGAATLPPSPTPPQEGVSVGLGWEKPLQAWLSPPLSPQVQWHRKRGLLAPSSGGGTPPIQRDTAPRLTSWWPRVQLWDRCPLATPFPHPLWMLNPRGGCGDAEWDPACP